MKEYFDISTEVLTALKNNKPVVALDSAGIFHGVPYPDNIKVALNLQEKISENGAVPAIIVLMDGKIKVGINEDEINYFAKNSKNFSKTSNRDLPILLAKGLDGFTTVSAAMMIAEIIGIKVLSTGGIGGVHRGAETTMDISSDLEELSTRQVMVVCAGAKAILDLGLTLEYLETKGIPVIGYQTDKLPAYYTKESNFNVDYKLDTPEELAKAFFIKEKLKIAGGMLVTNPIPEIYSLDYDVMNKAIDDAVKDSFKDGVKGKEITPYILKKVKTAIGNDSLESQIQLQYNNAILAAKASVELSKLA